MKIYMPANVSWRFFKSAVIEIDTQLQKAGISEAEAIVRLDNRPGDQTAITVYKEGTVIAQNS